MDNNSDQMFDEFEEEGLELDDIGIKPQTPSIGSNKLAFRHSNVLLKSTKRLTVVSDQRNLSHRDH